MARWRGSSGRGPSDYNASMSRYAFAAVLVWVSLGSLGCVERRLLITSEPTGALVYLNDQEVGRTPLEVPFTWYGTYDVRLEAKGYRTLETQQLAEQPWWELPGPDLIAEAIPGKRVEIAWHLKMDQAQPASETEPERVLEYANQLRELNRRGE